LQVASYTFLPWRFRPAHIADNRLPTVIYMHMLDAETTDMLRTCLSGCSDDMEVEVHPGVPLVAKTVADLRALNAWSPYWVLIVPYERQRPESVVTVELW
jgi:hypothetical protein